MAAPDSPLDPVPAVDGTGAPVMPQGERLAGADVVLLARGVSAAGKTVTLSRAVNRYPGASPYYVVMRLREVRYPVAEQRARGIFSAYLRDITDPQAVAEFVKGAA